MNTVELSTIDTALAVAGVVTAGQYFDGNTPVETEIRSMANDIYGRVNWNFMLDPQSNQFYLGWKPTENRYNDDTHGRYLLDDAQHAGQYSSKSVNGVESPATIDYYTDEGLLIALLAMGSPTPAYRVGPQVWDAMYRVDQGEISSRRIPAHCSRTSF